MFCVGSLILKKRVQCFLHLFSFLTMMHTIDADAFYEGNILKASAHGLGVYMLVLILIVLQSPRIFSVGRNRLGLTHKRAGFVHLVFLIICVIDLNCDAWSMNRSSTDGEKLVSNLYLHLVLGISGIVLTFTAAYDFRYAHQGHKLKNIASGALDDKSTVTYNEMLEHAFYQILNVVQVLFLTLCTHFNMNVRLVLLFIVTSPWGVRHLFPVNSFSDNYTKYGTSAKSTTGILYRLKKYQYIFYKHFMLHGLNVSIAVSGFDITSTFYWRVYWLGLNIAYVMEFFMQTLVKRRIICQSWMLCMNVFLMISSSLAAFPVMRNVNFPAALLSLVLNFINRKRDCFNVAVTTVFVLSILYYNG